MVAKRRPEFQREPIVGAHQPGTMIEQFAAILAYHQDPEKVCVNDPAAWSRARRKAMPHVGRAEARQ